MATNSGFRNLKDQFLTEGKEALLARMSNRIRQSLNLQEILDATVVELRAFLQTDRTKVYRFDHDGHGHVVAEASAPNRLPSLLGLHYPSDDIPPQARALFIKARTRSIVNVSEQRIILNSLPTPNTPTTGDLTVEEVQQQPLEDILSRPVDPCHVDYLTQMGVQSSLVVPIIYQQQLWGLLISHHAEPREITSEDLLVVQLLADQVSLAITQANLLNQVQEQQQREAIVNQIATLLHAPLNPEQILHNVLEKAVKASGSSGGRLYLTSPDEALPAHLYTYGNQPVPSGIDQPNLLENHPLWQKVGETPTPIDPSLTQKDNPPLRVVINLQQEPRLHQLIESFQTTHIQGLIIQPLYYGKEFLGYLTFFRDQIGTKGLWPGYKEADERQQRPRESMAQWQALKEDKAHSWSIEEMELIQSLNIHLSLAVLQNRLYQRERQQRLVVEMHNEALSHARAAAEEVSRLKSNFLASTSHELRTPLASTLNYLKLLKERLYEDEEELRQYIDGAYQSTQNLVTIINDVLDIAKIEDGRIALDLETVYLEQLLQEQCFLSGAESRYKSIPLTLHCEIETVFADKIKVRQVMTNLLDNAFKFTDEGQIDVRAVVDSTGTMAQISVHDTGIGIEMENSEQLFSPFVQADGSAQRAYGGTGLGLTICKRLVELMGGKIWLESPGLGQGNTVNFTLPLNEQSQIAGQGSLIEGQAPS
ncbi:ATP-binding protein [Nostoc sp. 'Lobaria pulmonaria (5183) cyanobiont']|uniref:ATP-binding protein n=1 Tax=Nostoc sp. 'Lobaria pulmonaria (5183) cyanobiont' TaxID=1618022 RepID=UPI000CF33463|nr:ATP-binding protein [Nostoc sp. 'Lobaria pulmonaria (5183) cyanobiont']AVH70960.1 histidine kinase [Nostoc sp. 'Lobaria pulmonaria (5183) cyanobiont']